MQEFSVIPKIVQMNDCEELCVQFKIGCDDLIITSRHIFDDHIRLFCNGAQTVFLRDFGKGEPTDVMVDAIADSIKGRNFNRVIAIGGGSILDVGKLFCLKTVAPVCGLFCGNIIPQRDKELIMVPTTCGTGSEVTNISILELTELNTKKGLAVSEIYANYAVLIPNLLKDLPFEVFATSSIDAFIHCIEAYLSPKATSFTKLFSIKGIQTIIKGYIKIAQEGSIARYSMLEDFLLASTYAGIAFGNAGCAAVHALSYPLGAICHVPHGESNYAMFAGVFDKYKQLKPTGELDRLEYTLAKQLGCDKENVYVELASLLTHIIPKKSLHEYGVHVEELKEFAASVMKNQQRLLSNNYTQFTESDILDIYSNLY